ncbi:hypothetical protein NJLHNGOC_14510 [Novacetimonas cocois]|uniref:Transposase IS4-like domain-containing protein n=1 Tax=Novacetimonas cocois TaxID=1747507 RepID=A0A365YQB8_9PROT|nr:hypothetical protein NJLHNGOC_14510 [Novacetimonas cocois]
MVSKLHAVCDDVGRTIAMLLTEGQMSDHRCARIQLPVLPDVQYLTADKGYDSAYFREVLASRGIAPCIPSTKNAGNDCLTIGILMGSDTGSRTFSGNSRTGVVSQRVTTAAPTLSSQPSAS